MHVTNGHSDQPYGEQKVNNIPRPVVMAILVVLAFFLLGSCAALIVYLLRPQPTATNSVSGFVTIQGQAALPQTQTRARAEGPKVRGALKGTHERNR